MRMVIPLVLAALLAACGPERSSFDETADEQAERNAKATAIQEKAVGIYSGSYHNGVKDIKVTLRVRVFNQLVASGGRMEVLEVPSLIAFMTPSNRDTPPVVFTQGNYNQNKNILSFYGAGRSDAGYHYIEAELHGNKIIGTYISGVLTSPVEFTKIGE